MSKVSTKLKSWRAYLFLGILAFVTLIGVGIVLLESSTCSFLRGTCEYDPRTEKPSSLFISNSPEQFVAQYIEDQMKIGGTFPISASSPVLKVTPIWVHADGFNTDLHIWTRVRVQVQYVDNTDVYFEFRLNAPQDTRLFGIESSTMFARFKPISECGVDTMTADTFYCY